MAAAARTVVPLIDMLCVKSSALQAVTMRLFLFDLYLASRFLPAFLFGLGILLSASVSVSAIPDLAREVVRSNLAPWTATQIFLLRVPQFLAYTLPVSTLLAALTVYGRLSDDNEIVALRSAGIGIYRLVAPVLAVIFLITGLTFAFNEMVVPEANYRSRTLFGAASGESQPAFKEGNILMTEFDRNPTGGNREALVRFFYAEQFDGEQMQDVTAIDSSGGHLESIVRAAAATWNPQQNVWEFFDGTMYLIEPDASYGDIIRFDRRTLEFPSAPLEIARRTRSRFSEINILQAFAQLRSLEKFSGKASRLLKLRVRIQEKIAFPFICPVFGLIGISLGIGARHINRATGFGISVAAAFLYYLLAFTTSTFGIVGFLPPVFAAWLPNVLCLGLGLGLLQRLAR